MPGKLKPFSSILENWFVFYLTILMGLIKFILTIANIGLLKVYFIYKGGYH